MGRPSIPSAAENMAGEYEAMSKYMPSILKAINDNKGADATSSLDAAKSVASGYNELGAQQQQASSKSGLDLLEGVGGDFAKGLQNLQEILNPDFYTTRSATANGLKNLLGTFNVNGLSNSENAAVQRGVNQSNVATGNGTVGSATTTTNNAMQFGDAFNKKRQLMSSVLQGASSALPALGGGSVNAADVMFGKPVSTFGEYGNIGQNTTNAGMNLFDTSSNNQTSLLNSQLNQQPGWARGWQMFNGTLGAIGKNG